MRRNIPRPNFKEVKPINVKFSKFPRGLNNYIASTKIRDDELSVANNIILVDDGSPVKRWGTANFGINTLNNAEESFVDNFSSASLDLTKWTDSSTGNASIVTEELNIDTTLAAAYHFIYTSDSYNLTKKYVNIKIVDKGDQSIASYEAFPLMVEEDSNNQVSFKITGSQLQANQKVAGSDSTLATAVWNDTTHNYLQIRERDGVTYWEYSSDGSTWNTMHSKANPITFTSVTFLLMVGTWQVEGSTTTMILDDFELAGKLKVDTLTEYFGSDGTRELIKIEEGEFKRSSDDGASWEVINGATFDAGNLADTVMAQDSLYAVNGVDPLTFYDGSLLTQFNEISAPPSTWVDRGTSLVSGQNQYSYRVTAETDVGETDATGSVTIDVNTLRENWNTDPQDLILGMSTVVRWTPVTDAIGYNIYGVIGGTETFLANVKGEGVKSWRDYGTDLPSEVFTPPTGNGTTGPVGEFIEEFKTSILMNDVENPSRLWYSAGVDKPHSFLISDGGGYVDISKNSDDGDIKGIKKYQDKVVIGKERSIWQVDFTDSAIPSVANIVNGLGFASHKSIIPVENDLFFLGRKVGIGAAVYVLGNEPNYFSVLRTNELSARVRPHLAGLSPSNYPKASAIYYDSKYILFYANGGVTDNNAAIVYDRERLGFTYWYEVYGNHPLVFYNDTDDEYLLYVDNEDLRVSELDPALEDDKGEIINWSYKTKETDLKDPFLYKRFKWINARFRNVKGTVRVKVWTDSNETLFSSSITSAIKNTAFGTFNFGIDQFGTVDAEDESATDNLTIKRFPISRQGVKSIAKSVAFEVYGEEKNSKATLLDVNIKAKPKSINYYPRSEVVS